MAYNVFRKHWRGRGISYYKSVKGAGALPDCLRQAGKAKTMTSLLIIPSVLAGGVVKS